ncbi:hypothetical protein KQX54_007889 [Cotesia glomerata]|uniref:Uncharacterized protein n=1 Tax=Cotesia glomerata TaxID=32391 RepID=A0AAV7I7X7_COTGL|nr:hypothetical protein KQX54_007889 [Cotesia glomerata]
MCSYDTKGFLINLTTEHPIWVKTVQWVRVMVCVSFSIMSQYYSYEIPTWLWIVYCIGSTTYLLITMVIIMSYVFHENSEILDFYFTAIGVPLYLIGAIGGIVQEIVLEPEDAANGPNQLYLSAIFIG